MTTTLPPRDDEFYIGYGDRMPPRTARRVRVAVACFVGVAATAVVTVLLASETLAPARFEFGVVTGVTGVLRRAPYPVLETTGRRVWLAGPGKFGADRVLEGVPDGPVTLMGSRIQRGRHEMLEIGVRPLPGLTPIEVLSLGVRPRRGLTPNAVSLRGEIVDSKCFLGVMNPGHGAVHRDCATRCLSGGMPPMLLVRDGGPRDELVLLVSPEGRPIGRELARSAGRSIEVTGQLVRDGDDYVLYASRWHQPAGK